MHGENYFQGGTAVFLFDDGSRGSAMGGLSSKAAYLGNSSKCISRQFVILNPLRAWPLRALRLGEKPSFGVPWLLLGFLSLTAKAQRSQREIAMKATRNVLLKSRASL